MDIKSFLQQDEQKDLLRLLTAGSVDDGKSTLIGRLLYDSKLLYEDQLSSLERDSKRVGHAGEEIDYALLLDGLKAEREQGITIDVAYRYFSTNKRKFIIADTPGHEQYTRNMATGGSTANLAIILTDATQGVLVQTKRHTFIARLLGIKHVVLAVNKMDLVDFDEKIFRDIVAEYKQFITRLNIPDVQFVPLSALKGDNVVEKSTRTPWYHGPSLLKYLEDIPITSDRNFVDMRFPVQYVNRPDRDFRGFTGTLASGVLRVGETVMALPSRKTSKVTSIIHTDSMKYQDSFSNSEEAKDKAKEPTNSASSYERNESQPQPQSYAFPPQAITVTLADEIDISRGEMLVHPNNLPRTERRFEAMVLWMDEQPMDATTQFFIKHTTNITKAKMDQIRYLVDVNTLHRTEPGDEHPIQLNQIGRAVITTARPLFFDPYQKNQTTGAFILIDPVTHNTAAVGMIIDRITAEELSTKISANGGKENEEKRSTVSLNERINIMGQEAKTLWITGLHGSGKIDLAYSLERELFNQGKTVVVLDGQSIRSGLSRELDFTPEDRAENLRRVAETAKILNDHNIIVIAAFLSPQRSIRRQVADIIGKKRFFEIYTEASLNHCRSNDRNGLYEKADKGLVKLLPGVDTNYDEPEEPDLKFDTVRNDLEQAVEKILVQASLI